MSFSTIGRVFAGAWGAKALAHVLKGFGGATTGFALGMLVFDALFPERPNVEPSKLADLHYMGSSYGTSWAKIWGDVRIGGQVSYLHKDAEGNHFKEVSSGGGGKKSPGTGPDYAVTGFVGFGQATIYFPDNTDESGGELLHRDHRIFQVWANQSELIYEVNDLGVVTTNPYGLVPVQGTESQVADSDIVALEGLGSNTPAMRGIVGFYFKNLKCKKWGNTIPQLSARIKTAAVTTGDIISDICRMHGLKVGKFDVSLCTQPVTGMVWNAREEGRKPLEQILLAYDIDVAQIDGVLKFIPRTAAATYDVSEHLLGASSGGRKFKEQREYPSGEDRPTRVTVWFLDPDSSFNQNTAEAARQTVFEGSDYSLTTSLVLTAAQAEEIARRILDRFWTELDEVTISLPTHGMVYAPGDKLRITIDGVETTFRVEKMGLGPIGEVSLSGTVVDDDTLSQTVSGSSGNTTPTPVTVVPSTFIAFSAKEMDDSHQSSAGFYVAASGDVGWLNGQVYYLPPGGTEYIAGPLISSRCTFGETISTLSSSGAVAGSRDSVNTVDVDVSDSFTTLESMEDVAVDQGNNWCWIGEEIAGFSDAALITTSQYTLSEILRGLRSSTMSGHITGERFVLATTSIAHIPVPDSHVGLDYDVKVLSPGQGLSDVIAQAVTIIARTPTPVETLAEPSYVTLALNSSIPNERVLAVGAGLSLNDGGAGGNVTISAVKYETLTESDSTYAYYAVAPVGSNPASSIWRVYRRHKLTQAITKADGNRNYDNVGSGLAALTYS